MQRLTSSRQVCLHLVLQVRLICCDVLVDSHEGQRLRGCALSDTCVATTTGSGVTESVAMSRMPLLQEHVLRRPETYLHWSLQKIACWPEL